jgi:exosortase C (VPDSG-CTERM-specific)
MHTIADRQRHGLGWAVWAILLTLLFMRPLAALMRHAAASDLHSHVVLVPFIAGYLFYSRRQSLPAPGRRSLTGTAIMGGVGFAILAAGVGWRERLSVNDHLALTAISYVSFLVAGAFLSFGTRWVAAAAFPFAFLIFLAPLPDAAVHWLERASALASADVAAVFFAATGTPLVREGPVFELPGIVLQVARECSGIRSSWVLFITSVLASHLFLRRPWRRLVLVAFVIPLGILRNGFRVFVIGMLCVHVGPHMIDSIIHRQGGPAFFLLSLVPLFLLLWWLRRQERWEERRKPLEGDGPPTG